MVVDTRLFVAAIVTVFRMLLCIAAGAGARRWVIDPTTAPAAIKGLTFIAAMVLLPCLLFSRMVSNFTLDLIYPSMAIMFVSGAQIILGHILGRIAIATSLAPSTHKVLVTMGCSFQNAVAYPLGVLESCPSGVLVYFTSLSHRHLGQTLIFTYNLVCSTVLWSLGNFFVSRLAVVTPMADASPTHVDAPATEVVAATASSEAPRQGKTNMRDRLMVGATRIGDTVGPFLSLPVVASLAGITVALVPPLKQLFEQGPLFDVLQHGIASVADGTIALYLILLGSMLATDTSAPAATPTTAVADEDDAGGATASAAAVPPLPHSSAIATSTSSSTSKQSPQSAVIDARPLNKGWLAGSPYASLSVHHRDFVRACVVIGVVRLLLVPFAFIAIVFGITGPEWATALFSATTSPSHLTEDSAANSGRLLIFVLVVELCSPPAINTLVIMARHGLDSTPFARMLVAVYTASMASTGCWLLVASALIDRSYSA
jgi:predicted permease